MTQIDTDELKAIARNNFNRIPSVRGDQPKAFFQTLLIWLAEWSGIKQFRQDITLGYCALVLAPEIVTRGIVPEGGNEVFCFKDDKTPLLGGNIYITDYALNRVFCFAGGCKDLNDTIRMLKKNGVSDLPFVAFDTDSQTVYVFEDGGEKITWKFLLREDIPRPFTIDVFEEMLEDVYVQSLKYPNGYPPIWYNAKERIPCKETEMVIQSHVACILRARAQGCRTSDSKPEWLIVIEEQNNAGRVDIAVYRDQSCIVVSELKVLRQYRYPDPNRRKKRLEAAKTREQKKAAMAPSPVSAETNEKWALRGARQVKRYKIADGAKSAALILYDMRETNADLPGVKTQCIDGDVRYLRYYLHNQLPDER